MTLPRAAIVPSLPERTSAQPGPPASTRELELVAAPPPVSPTPTDATFTLRDAIVHALQANPRLLVYRAAVDRAVGQVDVAFAPFLPHLDLLTRAGAVNSRNGPGAPGIVGGIVPDRINVPYAWSQAELQIQWTLCDFGRTSGRHGQSLSRERIAALQYSRAKETVAFDAATAYLDSLQTKALRLIQEEAIRQAEAILADTKVRHEAGVLLREAVLRSEVLLSEAREGSVFAQEAELAAQARLNNVLGRDASLPIQLADRDVIPLLALSLDECLRLAATQRLEVGVVRESIAAATQGREAAAAEFLPRLYLLSGLGNIQGENVLTGWAGGAGIHLSQPIYHGGQRRGELFSADAEVQSALAQSRVLLDNITLEVTLAYREVTTARQRIELSRPAVTQADENLRLLRVRYRNGDATPLDIVDAQTALTRARQRLVGATYDYQIALARLDYALGNAPGCLLEGGGAPRELPAVLPPPRPEPRTK